MLQVRNVNEFKALFVLVQQALFVLVQQWKMNHYVKRLITLNATVSLKLIQVTTKLS